MPRFLNPQTVKNLAQRALARGGVLVKPREVEWDISGFCQHSIGRTLVGRYEDDHPYRAVPDWPVEPWTVHLRVRCSKCTQCLRVRAGKWRERARREIFLSMRTWFVSLTMSPEEHSLARYRAQRRLAAKSVDFRSLSEIEQFAEHAAEFGAAVTLWIKRLREATKVPFRYVLIFERHEKPQDENSVTVKGYPHAHLLIHETSTVSMLRKRQLQGQWPHGFSSVKLADPDTASYVTKYLTKQAPVRIRASVGYGEGIRPKGKAVRRERSKKKPFTPHGVNPPKGHDLPPFGWDHATGVIPPSSGPRSHPTTSVESD